MTHSGARQWRVKCECGLEDAEHLRMHSQVSQANLSYFITEDRLAADLTESELRSRYEEADGTLIVCNECGDLKEVDA